jgi:hypothetical protein
MTADERCSQQRACGASSAPEVLGAPALISEAAQEPLRIGAPTPQQALGGGQTQGLWCAPGEDSWFVRSVHTGSLSGDARWSG